MKFQTTFLMNSPFPRALTFFLIAALVALLVPPPTSAQEPPTSPPAAPEVEEVVAEEAQEGSEIPLEEKDLDTPEKMQAEITRLTHILNERLASFKGNQRRIFGPRDLEYNDPLPQRQRLIWRYYEQNPGDPQVAVLMNERWQFMTTRMKQGGFTMSETIEVQKNEEASPALRTHAVYWRAMSSLYSTIKSPLNTPKRLIEQAEKFINAYPDDPRGASILGFIVLRLDRFPEEQLALYRRIGAEYPETFMGQIGLGKARQVDEIGKPFSFEFTDLTTGVTKTLADLQGKVVVIDFMSTFCRPCLEELPKLMNLQNSFADQGVVFIAVSLDRTEAEGGKEAILGMIAETELDWPVFYQGMSFQSDFSRSWGINRVPVQFVIDQNGLLRSTNAGSALELIIKGLLEEAEEAEAASSDGG